ncbi:MAG: phosphatidylglycerophosphatase A [Nitrospirae bacterium]|nr:phosphatidylglycerophosphatase A [Nitrospirota bacterium]
MRIQKAIATLGFIGYLPVAPGTWGSAFGLLLAAILNPSDHAVLIAGLVVFIIGSITAHSTEKLLGKDNTHIVIDELCGYLISILFIPKTIPYLVAAFLIFRVFDIIKPPPARNAERAIPGGLGIMLDDVFAGIYTNLCIQLWLHLV